MRRVAVQDAVLLDGEAPFDIAFAVRVGALDGRHPELTARAPARIAAMLTPGGVLFVDGGGPQHEVRLPDRRPGSARRVSPPGRTGSAGLP